MEDHDDIIDDDSEEEEVAMTPQKTPDTRRIPASQSPSSQPFILHGRMLQGSPPPASRPAPKLPEWTSGARRGQSAPGAGLYLSPVSQKVPQTQKDDGDEFVEGTQVMAVDDDDEVPAPAPTKRAIFTATRPADDSEDHSDGEGRRRRPGMTPTNDSTAQRPRFPPQQAQERPSPTFSFNKGRGGRPPAPAAPVASQPVLMTPSPSPPTPLAPKITPTKSQWQRPSKENLAALEHLGSPAGPHRIAAQILGGRGWDDGDQIEPDEESDLEFSDVDDDDVDFDFDSVPRRQLFTATGAPVTATATAPVPNLTIDGRRLGATQEAKRLEDDIDDGDSSPPASQEALRNPVRLKRGRTIESIEDLSQGSGDERTGREGFRLGRNWRGVGSDEDIDEDQEPDHMTPRPGVGGMEDIDEDGTQEEGEPLGKRRKVAATAFSPKFKLTGGGDQAPQLLGPPGSSPQKRRRRVRGGYSEMLRQMLALQKSKTTAWQNAMEGASGRLEFSRYRIESLRKDDTVVTAGCVLLPPADGAAASRPADPERATICFSDPDDRFDFAVGAAVRIFPPWAQVPGPGPEPEKEEPVIIFCRLFVIEDHALGTQLGAPSTQKKPASLFSTLKQFGSLALHTHTIVSRAEIAEALPSAPPAHAPDPLHYLDDEAQPKATAVSEDDLAKEQLTQVPVARPGRGDPPLVAVFNALQTLCVTQNPISLLCRIQRVYSTAGPSLLISGTSAFASSAPSSSLLSRKKPATPPKDEPPSALLWSVVLQDQAGTTFLLRLRDPPPDSGDW